MPLASMLMPTVVFSFSHHLTSGVRAEGASDGRPGRLEGALQSLPDRRERRPLASETQPVNHFVDDRCRLGREAARLEIGAIGERWRQAADGFDVHDGVQ